MSDLDLTLHRVLKAPRKLVWECWTNPEHLKNFFVPKPHQMTEVKLDLRAGGAFCTTMLVDGTEYPNDGSYLEVVPEERLVFTDMLLAGWKPVEQPGLGFTAILTLKDHPDGTDYTAVARHATAETAKRHSDMGFQDGWGTVASQLEDYARGLM